MTQEFEQQLDLVKQKCLKCEKCSLCHTRTNTVFSGGVPNSKLMLIGEAPGYYEDQKGEPFVGKAANSCVILFSLRYKYRNYCIFKFQIFLY